ncbi:MAG TPA: FhaA domain-containing protein [Anaerolineae bacterium]|nr:FhaA domain-containing protein [Anaerolineae bacterium]
MKKTHKRLPARRFPSALRDLARLPGRIDAHLQSRLRRPLLPHQVAPILPADVSRYLQAAMLAPQNTLEDAQYLKVVPNDYLVELNPANYQRHYQPVEKIICEQWQQKLLDTLNIQNGRQGRKEYRFGGPVRVNIRAAPELNESEVRVQCQVNPEIGLPAQPVALACLELLSAGRQWPLQEGITTIGRYEPSDICLDLPVIQQKRLVSGQHAYIRAEGKRFRLYDGSPEGKASVNGTFVNGQRVSPAGWDLHDGDMIILAALNPSQPRPDTPGVAAFLFHANCP